MRATPQRLEIEAALRGSEGFLTSQDVHALLRERGRNVGLATVYRHLNALAELGEVDTVTNVGGETAYRSCSNAHHHHIVCTECGRTVEVSLPSIERSCDRVAAEHGFTDVRHVVEMTGVCSRHRRA